MTTNNSTLFTIPIASTGGTFTCTSPSPKIYLLTFTSPPDNRLTPSFVSAFHLSLDIIEHKYPNGVLITTSGIPKFYSNGLDLDAVLKSPESADQTMRMMYKLWARLLTYPMPTVAWVNGHAFAGGFFTIMHQDYRIMNPNKGFVSINEIAFGLPLNLNLVAISREKIAPTVLRDMILEAKRYGGPEALAAGIVDGLGGLEEVLKFIKTRNLTTMGKTGIHGRMKDVMYRKTLDALQNPERDARELKLVLWENQDRMTKSKENVKLWEKAEESQSKAKL